MATLVTFTIEYLNGRSFALIQANGTMANASSTRIKIIYMINDSCTSIKAAKVPLKRKAAPKNIREDNSKDIKDVEITFPLSGYLLKNRKKAVSIPYANTTLKMANHEKITDISP